MKFLDNILLTQDFSKSSSNILDTAIDLAKVFKSKITPIYVLPEHIENVKVRKLLNETALTKLKETIDNIKTNSIETGDAILGSGSTPDAIIRAAVRINANLIIAGAGENLGGKNFKLGTTTERIIQKSEKPVFVVKEDTPLNVQQILCPVDFSDASKRALTNAIIMSKKFRADLTILSVYEVEESSWFFSGQVNEEDEESNSGYQKHKKQFDTFLSGYNLTGVNWVKESPKGKPSQEILSAISRKMVDLLVMGTNGRTGLNRLIMGSVTEKVIREVPCSFLTLKSEDAFSLQLETNIKDIEQRYATGVQLMEDGFYDEAIGQFKSCLSVNNMHIPAYLGIAKVYDKLNEPEKAKIYRDQGMQIKEKIWYSKIEDEVRKLRGS